MCGGRLPMKSLVVIAHTKYRSFEKKEFITFLEKLQRPTLLH